MAASDHLTGYLLVLLSLACCSQTGSQSYEACSAVKYAYSAKGFNSYEVPSNMISGEYLAPKS